MTEDLILKFETLPGRSPKLEVVARALEAWSDVLRTAAEIAEPGSVPSIELVGVEPGSQVFRIALRKVLEVSTLVKVGSAEYPLPAKAAITLSGMIVSGLIGTGLAIALTPDPKLPPEQMAVFKRTNELLKESNELQRQNMEFYGIMQEEPAFTAVKVLNRERETVYEIPRSEFAARSGVWADSSAPVPPDIETRRATWDVTLIKPVLEAQPRRWVFARDGLKFSALMDDKRVLEAIHDKTLPIQVAEGILMKIEVQYKEQLVGQVWVPIDRTRKVTRVLNPVLPVRVAPLFFQPGGPEEDN